MSMAQIINTMKPLGKTCAAKTGLSKGNFLKYKYK